MKPDGGQKKNPKAPKHDDVKHTVHPAVGPSVPATSQPSQRPQNQMHPNLPGSVPNPNAHSTVGSAQTPPPGMPYVPPGQPPYPTGPQQLPPYPPYPGPQQPPYPGPQQPPYPGPQQPPYPGPQQPPYPGPQQPPYLGSQQPPYLVPKQQPGYPFSIQTQPQDPYAGQQIPGTQYGSQQHTIWPLPPPPDQPPPGQMPIVTPLGGAKDTPNAAQTTASQIAYNNQQPMVDTFSSSVDLYDNEQLKNLHIPRARYDKSSRSPESERMFDMLNFFLAILFLPFVLLGFTIKIVTEYERAVIFRLGRLLSGGAKGPGIVCFNPCFDEVIKVDLRTVALNVPPQQVMTKDSVQIMIDLVIFYSTFQPVASLTNIDNIKAATLQLAMAAMRLKLGAFDLNFILKEREAIAGSLQQFLDEATDPWGIWVEKVEIKDVRLPGAMVRAMSTEAETTAKAKANVTLAQGENLAASKLKEAADMLQNSKMSIQLRGLETLVQIASEKRSSLLCPLPLSDMDYAFDNKSWF